MPRLVPAHHALSATGTLDLLGNYTLRNIPVGAVNIDSQWQVKWFACICVLGSSALANRPHRCCQQSTFNDFPPGPKITNLTQLIDQLHSNNVRVIFWATSMVNVDCPKYSYALNNSFFIRDALDKQMSPIKWWHGVCITSAVTSHLSSSHCCYV